MPKGGKGSAGGNKSRKGGGGRPAFKKGASADNPDRVKKSGDTFKRDKSAIKILQMRKSGKPVRDKKGKILSQEFHDRSASGGQKLTSSSGRVQPDRRWFGNTRVVSQTELDRFRDAVAAQAVDPYTVVLHSKSVPMGLLADGQAAARAHLLSAESYSATFGGPGGRRRKRPRLADGVLDEASLAGAAAVSAAAYGAGAGDLARSDSAANVLAATGERAEARHALFDKGLSKRIWGELYKVLDCSDVVVMVLDARDPQGTRCHNVEKHLKENSRHKHVVLVLNKSDLVPTWVTRRWVAQLSREYPTLAFHASLTRPFGKGSLIALLRQLSKLHSEKKSISVGFVGYPNVGKSSVINALKAKKVCSVAPIPGQTRVWQYVSLMKRVSLIDCPGVVHDAGESESDKVLKGVVRAEKLAAPELFIAPILARCKREHLVTAYGVQYWTDPEDFLTQLCQRTGRLLRGGEPDLSVAAVNVINDWQRGKLPFYTVPPASDKDGGKDGGKDSVAAAAPEVPAAAAPAAAAATGVAALALPPSLVLHAQVLRRVGRHELLAAEEADEEEEADCVSEDGGDEDEEEEREAEGGAVEEVGAGAGAGAGASEGKVAAPSTAAAGSRKRPREDESRADPPRPPPQPRGDGQRAKAKAPVKGRNGRASSSSYADALLRATAAASAEADVAAGAGAAFDSFEM